MPFHAPTDIRRRHWLQQALALTGASLAPKLHATSTPARPRVLARTRIPYGQSVNGMRIGGLSALDQDAAGQWWFACDDHLADPPARMFRGRIKLDLSAASPHLTVELDAAIVLRTPGGGQYAAQSCDTEALRCLPSGELLIASEGHRKLGIPPWIRVFDPQGHYVRDFALPAEFARQRHKGPRPNQVFEGLALSANGRTAYAALEGPLIEDSSPPSAQAGAPIRVMQFDVQSGQQEAEFAYMLAPLPDDPLALGGALARTGVSEILDAGDGKLLVLERAFTPGKRFHVAIYEADFSQATDVMRHGPLVSGRYRAAHKRLIYDFSAEGVSVDNLEGMAWGPKLSDGTRVLLLCADDNFLPLLQTQLIALGMPAL